MSRSIALVWVGFLVLLPGNVVLGEGTPKPPCPSLNGEWFGEFDGSYSGDWSATFSQSANTINADASITLESGGRFEAEGSAGVSCEGTKTAIAGTGSVKGKVGSGSFSGISDDTGTHMTGTWWSGDVAGTWRGERTKE